MNELPSFVHIPDSKTEGIRSYREPDTPHPLQLQFLEEAGERQYVEHLRDLLSAGRLEEADAILAADLAGFEGRMAQLCKATTRETVTVEGWEDLLPILEEHEGPAITAITVGLTNDADLVFETDGEHDPALVVALYSDESFPFSDRSGPEILDECLSEDPAFAGQDEDVEFYAVSAGLAPLNSTLIRSMHRYFLRDGRDGVEGRAPGGYVEYVLATWLRALRFLQALRTAADVHGIPSGCRLIAGTAGLHTDFACIVGEGAGVAAKDAERAASAPAPMATLTMKKWEPKHDPLAEELDASIGSGSAIRRRIAEPLAEPAAEPALPAANDSVAAAPPSEPRSVAAPPPEPVAPAAPEPKRGFFARLFARRRAA